MLCMNKRLKVINVFFLQKIVLHVHILDKKSWYIYLLGAVTRIGLTENTNRCWCWGTSPSSNELYFLSWKISMLGPLTPMGRIELIFPGLAKASVSKWNSEISKGQQTSSCSFVQGILTNCHNSSCNLRKSLLYYSVLWNNFIQITILPGEGLTWSPPCSWCKQS